MPREFSWSEIDLPSGSEVGQLLAHQPDVQRVCFVDGEPMMVEGEHGDQTFIVLRGAYVVERKPRPGETRGDEVAIVVSDETEPIFVGEMAYLGEGVRTASVRSAGTTYALALDHAQMEALIDHFPRLTRTLCRQLSGRLKETTQHLAQFTAATAMNARQATLPEGTPLFAAGQPADGLWQLVYGSLTRDDTGAKLEAELAPGGFVDPVPFFSGTPHRFGCRTREPSMLVKIDASSMEAVLRNWPALAIDVIRRLK